MKTMAIRSAWGAAIVVAAAGYSFTGDVHAADFATRCADQNVVRCVAFDGAAELAGTYGDAFGVLAGNTTPQIDTAVKASGAGSVKFTIPGNTGANSGGSYFTNFTDDNSVQFGENAEFFIQWRQRFSPEFLNTEYDAGGGWKQVIIGTGDQGGQLYSSCTALETVVQNTNQRAFAQMYNSCTGSASHAPYTPFEEPFGAFDFKLQNARAAPYCLYSQNDATRFPPLGNCFGYFPNEWMTFQVHIKTGPRVNGEFANSFVQLWIAREGQPSELAIDWGPWNLTAGSEADNQRFGKVWLLTYHTNKSSAQAHPTGYVWYDELIVSRAKIADPDGTGGNTPRPPTNLTTQ